MKICRIAIDIANNMSAIGTKWYDVVMDETGNEVKREYITGTTRLWMDGSAQSLNSVLIPSIILYKSENEGILENDCIGWDAMEMLKRTDVVVKNPHTNIKYSYFVEGKMFGRNAKDFHRMVKYLMECISFKEKEEPDAYELSISYPVICQDTDKGELREIIGDVWFELKKPQRLLAQKMIDEADCALRFALTNKAISKQLGIQLSEKQEQLVLVVDIGGSTMELSLYEFSAQDKKGTHKRLGILRADDEAGRGMGGYKVDKALKNALQGIGVLNPQAVNTTDLALLMLRYFTPLKEEINDNLKAGKPAKLTRLHPISDTTKLSQHISVDKTTFEAWCKVYTDMLCRQIDALCKNAHKATKDVGMVILTGGGCELYPVKIAIQELLAENTPVLRPTDPTGVLDYRIQDKDHTDYIYGLCPCAELASLACVLGNLAEETKMEIVIPPLPASDPVMPKPKSSSQLEIKTQKKKFIPPKPVWVREFPGRTQCNSYGIWGTLFGCSEKCNHCNFNCTCDAVCTSNTDCDRKCAPNCSCDSHCSDCGSDCFQGYDSYCPIDCGWALG